MPTDADCSPMFIESTHKKGIKSGKFFREWHAHHILRYVPPYPWINAFLTLSCRYWHWVPDCLGCSKNRGTIVFVMFQYLFVTDAQKHMLDIIPCGITDNVSAIEHSNWEIDCPLVRWNRQVIQALRDMLIVDDCKDMHMYVISNIVSLSNKRMLSDIWKSYSPMTILCEVFPVRRTSFFAFSAFWHLSHPQKIVDRRFFSFFSATCSSPLFFKLQSPSMALSIAMEWQCSETSPRVKKKKG